jgi:hypothetical protein
MTNEEYLRMKNLLNTVIEQQVVLSENQMKADARLGRHEEAIASLLTIAQIHEQETTRANEQMNGRFEQIAAQFSKISEKSAETDKRINALVNIVERYISKN